MTHARFGRNMLVAATVVVVATLAASLWYMEPPSRQHDRRIDERRIRELQAIDLAIDAHVRESGRLPASLQAMASRPGESLAIVDPVSGAAYGYRATAANRYRLCATFATTTADRDPPAIGLAYDGTAWRHPAGTHCFARRIDNGVAPGRAP